MPKSLHRFTFQIKYSRAFERRFEFTAHDAVNLAQGFPDFAGPELSLGDLGGVYLFECATCPGRPGAHRYDC